MEELIKAINNVAEACGEALPRWASIAGIVAPIILTVITIYLSLRMDKQNKKLQKMLSDRDTINQTRECILNIYNSFYCSIYIFFIYFDIIYLNFTYFFCCLNISIHLYHPFI